tara:strand:+ start:183 stop:512 length:330 start_codon:yes stop_codon:yes gene_type:complete
MFGKGAMNQAMKQAKVMQEKIAKAQEELKDIEVSGQSGGGMVKVIANGQRDIISVNLNQEILSEDKDMVEDLILTAINQALNNAKEVSDKKMSSITGGLFGGLNLPGMV